MKNLRILALWLVLASPFGSAFAGPMEKAISSLPGDILAVALVADLKDADSDFRNLIEGLGLKDRIFDVHQHPLDRIKEKLPGLKGFDESGSLALVILNSTSLPELMSNAVVLIPASDAERLLDDLGGDPVSLDQPGVRAVLLFGQTVYATIVRNHVAVARTAEVARKVSRIQKTLRDRLTAQEIETLDKADAAMWLDAAAILAIFKPQIDGLMGWALMMQMGAGEVGEEEARASKKQVDSVVDGLSSLAFAAAVDAEGVILRGTSSTKPDSELAKQTRHAISTAPLLRGIPRRNYVAAFGFELHPDAVRAAITGGLDPVFAGLRSDKEIDQKQLAEVYKDLKQAIEMIRSVRGSIDHQYADGDGMIGLSLVLETTESAECLDAAERVARGLASLDTAAEPEEGEEDEWSPPISWERNAETIENAPVSRFSADVFSDPEMDEDQRDEVRQFLGKDGLTFRIAVVDAKTLACTFGGSSPQMARLIRSIRRNASPLQEEEMVAKADRHLSDKKDGLIIVALDRVVNLIDDVSYALDDEPLPFVLPRIDAPLAIGTTGGDGWSRFAMYLPMPLLNGIVTAANEMEELEAEIDELEADEDEDTEDDLEEESDDPNPE